MGVKKMEVKKVHKVRAYSEQADLYCPLCKRQLYIINSDSNRRYHIVSCGEEDYFKLYWNNKDNMVLEKIHATTWR